MQAIYSSKLYKASPRKQKIQAALMSPGNLELVQQLSDALDEEYKTAQNLGKAEEEPKEKIDELDFIVDEKIDPEKDLVTMDDLGKSSGISHPVSAPSSHKSEPKEDEKDESKGPDENLMPDSPMTEEPKEDVKTATLADLSILKGTLNNRQDTAGVTRIAEKENEIWIYYNDDVNLNNIMTEVIEFLLTSGYEQYEFNRLARSDNAIVFVEVKSTEEEPKQIEEVE